MKKILYFGIMLSIGIVFSSCKKEKTELKTTKVTKQAKGEEKMQIKGTEGIEKGNAVIDTKFGRIVIKFFPELAPNHVANFKKLAKKGFYNGTTFHRVIPGFMIQGGDSNSKDDDRSNDGSGGPGYTINAEFNKTDHKRGVLSMARSTDPNSAGSQFFICVNHAPHLNGQYTAFGEVVEGLDVVDKIVSQPRDSRDNPLKKVTMTISIAGE